MTIISHPQTGKPLPEPKRPNTQECPNCHRPIEHTIKGKCPKCGKAI